MNTSKSILLLSLLFFCPILIFGQALRVKPIEKKIGTKKYIVTTGDTTVVVNPVNGLASDETRFLFRKNTPLIDSLFAEIQPKYNSLEEAALDINGLLRQVEREQAKEKENDGLGFRISQMYMDNLKKSKVAQKRADSILISQNSHVNDLTSLYVKFGNKPTYYINGSEVPEEVVNYLNPSDIIKRTMKVSNTISGNPNGEVWYDVSDATLRRVGQNYSRNISRINSGYYDSESREKFDNTRSAVKKNPASSKQQSEPIVTYDMAQPNPYENQTQAQEGEVIYYDMGGEKPATDQAVSGKDTKKEPKSDKKSSKKKESKKSVRKIKESREQRNN